MERIVVSVCLFVCLTRSERKTARAIDTKLSRPIEHGRASACTDPEVKRSKVKVEVKVKLYLHHLDNGLNRAILKRYV